MSARESEAAVDRVAAKRAELGAEDFGAYAFLALALLAHQAPEVVQFILDRTDERATPTTTTNGN
jgi:hypothetical protein